MTSTPPSPASSLAPSGPSSTSTPGTGAGTAPAPAPKAPPVHLLSTKPARLYSLAHPVLLVLLLATRFHSLVADPVAELAGDLPYLALLQVVFVVVCLPAAGSGSTHAAGTGVGASASASASAAGTGAGAGSGTEGTDEERKKVGLGRSVRSAARRRAQHGKNEGVWVKVVVSF